MSRCRPGSTSARSPARRYERGVLVEDAAWHWARPGQAPPSLVLGYGALTESMSRNAIALIADALDAVTHRGAGRPSPAAS